MIEFFASDLAETQRLGRSLGRSAQAGDVLLLRGGLGVGKTEFSRAFAQGLGCDSAVRSPTFNLIHHHQGAACPFYHLDLYRIEAAEQLLGLGLEEWVGGDGIAAVEWSERLGEEWAVEALVVELEIVDSKSRRIFCAARGERATAWLAAALAGVEQ